VGDGELMHIRVATADHPDGPFIDAGVRLTTEDFAIDPHPFRDENGTWYLFYAIDFLQHTQIGTGTVCDVMLDFYTLKGEPVTITRALYNWQVFDPKRKEKGGVRWHTVEGPFVLRRKGIYYQMFSGGNWKNQTYGVAYALSDTLRANGEWKQIADGERILPILRTIPDEVIGPGHNSVVRGPDNLESYCIYHRWSSNLADRVLAIDRLDWAGERLLVIGPSTTPQPAPNPATVADFFDERREDGLGNDWLPVSGKWSVHDNMALQEAVHGVGEVRCKTESSQFFAEVSLRLEKELDGAFGIKLLRGDNTLLILRLQKAENICSISWQAEGASQLWSEQQFALPGDFKMEAFHLIRIEADSGWVRIVLDDEVIRWKQQLLQPPRTVTLFTSNASAAFGGFALTEGWQDLFTGAESDPRAFGWISDEHEAWLLTEKELLHTRQDRRQSIITKAGLPHAYELAINARVCSDVVADECCGFFPALDGVSGPLVTIEKLGEGWVLRCAGYSDDQMFYLPDVFDPFVYNQFRFRKRRDEILLQYESHVLGTVGVPNNASSVGLYSFGVLAAFDMVRVTAIQ
jgi:Glycosyl hydrolases family 43